MASPKAVLPLLCLLIAHTYAGVTLQQVPSSACTGNNAVGTATFTSSSTVPTGQILIGAGNYWSQTGAIWEISTDTKGFAFNGLGIPGYGAGSNSIPKAAEDALKLSNDKSTVTLSVPTTALGGSWDITFQAVSAAVANAPVSSVPTKPSPTWTAGACSLSTFKDKPVTCGTSTQQPLVKTTTVCACPSGIMLDTLSGGKTPCGAYTSAQGDLMVVTNACPQPAATAKAKRGEGAIKARHPEITQGPAAVPFGAKFRPRPRGVVEVLRPRAAPPAGQINLKFKATWPCLGPPKASASGASNSANPTFASLCSNNQISAGTAAWSTYVVSSYMASVLTAAEPPIPTPTLPVDGAKAIHDDVNPPGPVCTYTSKCNSVSCSSVRDYNSGTLTSIQRFLGYQCVVNFNNYLNSIYTAFLDSGTISSLVDGKIVTTFYTNPTPAATWVQIMGIFTPLLGAISGFLGPFAAVASAGFGVASGIGGSIAAIGTINSLQPVVDKRFTEYASIGDFIGHYLEAAVVGIGHAYDIYIGKDTPIFAWSGSPFAPTDQRHGIFGDGLFANSDYSQGMTSGLLEKMIRIFTYKAINFAWVDSGAFIIYVPYGRDLKGPDGTMIKGGINQDYCKNKLNDKSQIGVLTVCDVPGGMARIFNAGNTNGLGDIESSSPQGYNANFNVLPGEPFSTAGAVKGSVASWQAGDFGYDASNPYTDAFKSANGLTAQQVIEISKLKIAQETAGFFNIPVCQVFDLRYFPPASGLGCNACGSSTAVGGTKGSTKKFLDNVNQTVKKVLSGPPNTAYCGGYYSSSCTNTCPSDVYTG